MVSIIATSVNREPQRNHPTPSSILTMLSGLPSIKIFIIFSPQIPCFFNVKRPGNSTSISTPHTSLYLSPAKVNWGRSTASHKVFVDKSAIFCWHKHVAEHVSQEKAWFICPSVRPHMCVSFLQDKSQDFKELHFCVYTHRASPLIGITALCVLPDTDWGKGAERNK